MTKGKRMESMVDLVGSSRLEQLQNLLEILADEIDKRPGSRDLSQLARQYRETLKEIEEIEGMNRGDDEIEEIISGREADGESRAVRPDRTRIH